MAQLLSPVCTEALNFQNPLFNLCSRSSWGMLSKITTPWTVLGRGAKRRGSGRVRVASEDSPSTQSVAEDYYAVLGLVMFQKTHFFIVCIKRKPTFYVLRFSFLSDKYTPLKLEKYKRKNVLLCFTSSVLSATKESLLLILFLVLIGFDPRHV
jgi:hypothetical protein